MESNASLTYVIKRIIFNGKKVPVALQNTNGPCPLLAVANVLSLRGVFTIHDDKAVVSADELLAAVSDYLFDANTATTDSMQKNHERNVNDVIQMLPNTLIGIDVNLRFDTITSFEFNSDIILFDFCNIRLVHGWLVDPQNEEYKFIRTLSYNQLVERELEKLETSNGTKSPPRTRLFVGSPSIGKLSLNDDDNEKKEDNNNSNNINNDEKQEIKYNNNEDAAGSSSSSNSANQDRQTQALLAEQFLNETATQLTYHGLTELHAGLREGELCVFFRNNHFNTLYKQNGELFLLVTDQGYANEPLVWEKLCQIDGDSTFLKSDFTTYQATSPSLGFRNPETAASEDSDLALAMQLQDEENSRQAPPPSKSLSPKPQTTSSKSSSLSPNPPPSSLSQSQEKEHHGHKHKHKKDCIVQ